MSVEAQRRHDEAGFFLVGRGLLEGLLAGAALGPLVLLVKGLVYFAQDPDPTAIQEDGLAPFAMLGAYAAVYAAPFGLAGGVLALVALGVVAGYRRAGWTTSRAAWLAPALTVGLATTVAGTVSDLEWLYLAAAPAAAIAAWRVRRAVALYADARAATGHEVGA